MSAEQIAAPGDLTEQIERGLREVVGTDETDGGEVLFNVPSGFDREPITLLTARQLAERIAHRCASAVEVATEGCTCTAPEPDIDCLEHGDGKREERVAAPTEGEAASGDDEDECSVCGDAPHEPGQCDGFGYGPGCDGPTEIPCRCGATLDALRDASPAVEESDEAENYRHLYTATEFALQKAYEALRLIDRGCSRVVTVAGRCLTEGTPREEWCEACIAASVLPPAEIKAGVVLRRQTDLDACPVETLGRDANGFLCERRTDGWQRIETHSGKEPMKWVRLIEVPEAGDPS